MLESSADLTLAQLNDATQAWLHGDYHDRVHSELRSTPRERHRSAPSVLRPAPDFETLRRAFRRQETRTQRRSDGTVSVCATRFEVPSAYGHLRRLTIRYAAFDLRDIDLVDEATGTVFARLIPVDKVRNAEGLRRLRNRVAPLQSLLSKNSLEHSPELAPEPGALPPLLAHFLRDAAEKALPPSYLPSPESPKSLVSLASPENVEHRP
jgi:hypothetical protein